MRTIFVERGYPTNLLDSAIQKAFNNSHRDTLKPRWPKLAVIFKFLKTTLRRQPFSPITLLSLLDAIKTFEIIKCTVALDRIYRHKRVPFLALVLVVTRVHSSTLAHLFPDLNPISSFGTKKKTKEWNVRSQRFGPPLLDKNRNYEGIWSNKRKSFVKSVGMNCSNCKNETLFVSFTAIVTTRNGWNCTTFISEIEWLAALNCRLQACQHHCS